VAERRHLEIVGDGTGESADLDLAGELALPENPPYDEQGVTLYHAAAVRFEAARLIEHDAGDVSYARGDRVVCETPTGVAIGVVAVPSRRIMLKPTAPRILRRATSGDAAVEAHLRAREQAVWQAARHAAASIQLGVKVVRAEAANGGGRFIVYFASEAKLPFRDWLRAIGRETRERVELRQVGMRDAARLIGGVGPCGLQLCCNTFLSDFTPVGIKMAKEQGFTLNPQKVSGICGRLLCCLVYEEAHYRAGRKAMPEPGDRVDTPSGPGRAREVDVLQMRVVVELEDGTVSTFAASDVRRRRVE
jgi:cell fate regulator YaaT (PSP1 superfamily)